VRAFIVAPLNDADADLHLTNYDSVKFLTDNLQEFDDQMAGAENSEGQAMSAFADLSGQTVTFDDAAATSADTVNSMTDDQFAAGAADLQQNQQGSAAIVQRATDAQTSANQPLSVLQQDNPSGDTSTDAEANYDQNQQDATDAANGIIQQDINE